MKLDVRRFYSIFLHLAVIGLAVEVLVLIDQNRELKQAPRPPNQITVGDHLELDGLEVLTGETPSLERLSLVYVFTTSCRFCKQNKPTWFTIADLWQSSTLNVFGISVDTRNSTLAYISDSVNYPILLASDPAKYRNENRLAAVPQTILVSPDGEVKNVWTGVITHELMVC